MDCVFMPFTDFLLLAVGLWLHQLCAQTSVNSSAPVLSNKHTARQYSGMNFPLLHALIAVWSCGAGVPDSGVGAYAANRFPGPLIKRMFSAAVLKNSPPCH
jgi:hypothetical protein